MDRIPEPELMDEDDHARAYAEADFEEPHARCLELIIESFPGLPERGVAVDLGCGPGDIAMRFARAFPRWEVDGVDGAAAMLRYGQEALMRRDLADRVRLVAAYLPRDPLPRPAYDFVFSNSLLHHLADPRDLWRTVRRAAKPGAPVFVMDLMRPESREAARRLVDEHSRGEPELLRRDFFHSLLAAYRPDEVERQLAAEELPLEVAVVSDRHWVARGRVEGSPGATGAR
jgi:ubiquinone/menaquinone biosynthesis C-methylase UbiE